MIRSLLLSGFGIASSVAYFALSGEFVPPARGGTVGTVAVTFVPRDPDVRVNQDPAPRLELDSAQTILLDRQPPVPTRIKPFDPQHARYFDPAFPVRFAADLAPNAPKGSHNVKATVRFFYCSKREGWCRKGVEPIEIAVKVE